jgi:exosortase
MSATPAVSAVDSSLLVDRRIVAGTALAIVVASAVLLWPTANSLHRLWTDTARMGYTHGYLVVALASWLLVRAARRFGEPRADWRFVPLLAIGGVCWVILYRAGLELPHQMLLPIIAFMALTAAFGLANTRHAWFAFAYLYFAMSVWDYVNEPLQSLTVVAVRFMLSASGVPVYVAGDVLNIPEGSFAVEPGCSGLHFFIVALAFAALFGELHRDPWSRRLRQVLLAALLALFSNWVRVYCVVLAGHLTDMQHYLVRVEHYTFGWVVFAVAMVAFFWIASRAPLARTGAGRARAISSPVAGRRLVAAGTAGLAALALGPLLAARAGALPLRDGPVQLPVLAGWSGPNLGSGSWQPSFPHADSAALATYRRDGIVVAAFTAAFDEQHQGKELVGYGNSLFHGLEERSEGGTLATAHGEARWRAVRDPQGVAGIVGYYYRIGAQRRIRGMAAQLNYGAASLLGPVRSVVVAAMAECKPDCGSASARVRELLDAVESVQPAHP